MTIYYVKKYKDDSNKSWDYGRLNEEDMKLTVRGYKPLDIDPEIYTRRGSSYYFIVEKIAD